ncbi:hypothetical protein [Fodinibius sediminis]|uniref:Uncharacterized protein n=1 Tax=Fodinibius sediminis TaxID=1214077 RepID=A0A521BIC3_9BACT|nr:hypothetical protein [Fodinibius sediminis]SMO46842.1 hypothetical protein SAMN06265218_103142 [Fodinibius sediminis]
MAWLKDVIVDLIASAVIILAVLFQSPILTGIVWGYTGLLLIVKLLGYFGDGVLDLMSKAQNAAPPWFSHLLYALNTGVILIAGWFYLAIGWAIIWFFSYLTQRKIDQKRVAQ